MGHVTDFSGSEAIFETEGTPKLELELDKTEEKILLKVSGFPRFDCISSEKYPCSLFMKNLVSEVLFLVATHTPLF